MEEWIEPTPDFERDELLARFVIRYFAGHGPATVADLAWWARLTLADALRGIAAASDTLCDTTVDSATYWMTADSPDPSRHRAEALALSGFDEYLLGYTDRSRQLAPEHTRQIMPGANGIFLPTIVAAGRFIGTWRRPATNRIIEVVPEPFEHLTPTQSHSFEAAAKRYREFCAN